MVLIFVDLADHLTCLQGIEKFKKAAQDVQGKILSGQASITFDYELLISPPPLNLP